MTSKSSKTTSISELLESIQQAGVSRLKVKTGETEIELEFHAQGSIELPATVSLDELADDMERHLKEIPTEKEKDEAAQRQWDHDNYRSAV